uniref:BTB domain-containing protein n=1 Tax=Panagrolaimus davidi TaxID=227884 RepID=A0A914QKF8_9BILA
MVKVVEVKVATKLSIKKGTFTKLVYKSFSSKKIETIIPNYEYHFDICERNGDVRISFIDNCYERNAKVEEMTLSIHSADFESAFSEDDYDLTVIIKRDDLLNPDKKFFVNDILTLEFCGIVEYNVEAEIQSLGQTLWNGGDQDFTFIVGKDKVKAHKLLLYRYSTVLSEMCKSGVNQIKINNFNYDAVLVTMRLCYDLDSLRATVDNLLEAIRFTNVYDMPIIKEKAEHTLKDYINVRSVCKIANKSLEYDAPILKAYCINFISKCIKDNKQYDNALNLNQEIVQELYKSSVFHTFLS